MWRALAMLVATLAVAAAFAQENGGYTPAENPFQADFPFAVGKPIELRIDIQGLRVDGVTWFALEAIQPKAPIRGEVLVSGANLGKKATVTVVLLLEDERGDGLDRIALQPFKVKPGKPFEERQKLNVRGDSLIAATKAYVFVQVEF
jgi:hypothetical protein